MNKYWNVRVSRIMFVFLLVQQIGAYNIERTHQLESGNRKDFIFPDEMEKRRSAILPPPVCDGSTFCEYSHYYPESLVDQAIEKNSSLKLLENEDTLSDIVHRIDFSDQVPLCVSKEQIVYPTSAESKNNEWLHVVNQENFKQGVRIESCDKEMSECNLIDGMRNGYRMVCKQKYVYRQLMAISSDGTIVPELFRFPSCCCCQAEFDSLEQITTHPRAK